MFFSWTVVSTVTSTSLASSQCSATETSKIKRVPSSPIRLRKIDEVRRIAGKLPLETGFTAKGLKVRIGHPGIEHPLVAEVLKLLEHHQADNEPDGLGRATGLAIEPGEFLLEAPPRYLFGQFEQGMGGIELIQKVR